MTVPLADDLFAGVGGWDLGADSLGVHARGVENMPEARATRQAAYLTTVHDDVWTYQPDSRVEGLIASPPCQTFSKAGGGSGRKALEDVLAVVAVLHTIDRRELAAMAERFGDERTALVLLPLWFALRGEYRWLAWEQVPTVLPVWEACAARLREYGWHTWVGPLNAEQYGVPQTRRRAFLLASRDHPVEPPTPTHSRFHSRSPQRLDEGVLPWVSMAQALGWGMTERPYPTIAPGHTRAGGPDALAVGGSGARKIIYGEHEAGRWTPHPPEHALDEPCTCDATLTATNLRPNVAHRPPCQPAPTMAFGHEQPRWNPRDTTPDGLPRWAQQSDNVPDYGWPDNRPSTTVAGRDLVQAPGATANRHNGRTKSRNDGVRVSVAEAGLLQSFPPTFPWCGGKSKQYVQVGNAVPPRLARAALSAVLPQELRQDPLPVNQNARPNEGEAHA